MLVHLTAHTRQSQNILRDPDSAWWLWSRLRNTFPLALAATLMPNHAHLALRVADPQAARAALGSVLGGHARHIGARVRWHRVGPPTVLGSRSHLLRTVRYITLNARRAGLTRDILGWPWCTHRGLVGAELEPWAHRAELARELGRSARSTPEWLHDYISTDAETDPEGTPFPQPAPPREEPVVSLDQIVDAAASATPWSSLVERRHLVVLLARHQGFRSSRAIAEAAGITTRHVRSFTRQPRFPLLAAGALCLGDSRLVVPARLQPPPATIRRR